MLKKLLFFVSLIIVLASCKKTEEQTVNCIPNNTGVPTAAEIASLQAYLTSKSITATQDPGGFFYIIVAPGTGVTPALTSKIKAKYVGTLEDGTQFGQNIDPAGDALGFLSGLVLGWQRGLPLIKKGGTIKLYLPPSLGYGCAGSGSVPSNANLIFTLDLVDVY
jgi:FKBP-type peptidyl-prolyl cis-trans isomerase FkpA